MFRISKHRIPVPPRAVDPAGEVGSRSPFHGPMLTPSVYSTMLHRIHYTRTTLHDVTLLTLTLRPPRCRLLGRRKYTGRCGLFATRTCRPKTTPFPGRTHRGRERSLNPNAQEPWAPGERDWGDHRGPVRRVGGTPGDTTGDPKDPMGCGVGGGTRRSLCSSPMGGGRPTGERRGDCSPCLRGHQGQGLPTRPMLPLSLGGGFGPVFGAQEGRWMDKPGGVTVSGADKGGVAGWGRGRRLPLASDSIGWGRTPLQPSGGGT